MHQAPGIFTAVQGSGSLVYRYRTAVIASGLYPPAGVIALFIAGLCSLCLGLLPGLAQAAMPLQPQMPGLLTDQHITVLEDPGRQLAIADILQPDTLARFRPPPRHRTAMGASTSAWWVLFDIDNPGPAPVSWLLEAIYTHTDYLDIYRIDAAGHISNLPLGDSRPLHPQAIPSETWVVPFTTPAQSRERFLLRFCYTDVGLVEVLTRVWDPQSYNRHATATHYLYGFILGAALLVLLFNLTLQLASRTAAFYWYLGCIVSATAAFIANSGLGHRYLWASSPFLTNSAHVLLGVLTLVCALQFNRSFLQTRTRMPRIDRVLALLAGLCGAVLLLDLGGWRTLSIQVFFAVSYSLVLMPLAGLWVWLRYKDSSARWYTLAWSLWSLAFIVIAARLSGVLPLNDTVIWITRMGFLVETVLMGLAVVDQVNLLRRDKDNTERELVQVLENARSKLETSVRERTLELELARQEAEAMAHTDMLTGIGNRRWLFSRGQDALELARRHRDPLSVVIVDIDHFKAINDTRGHDSGDKVIHHLAQLLVERLRRSDIIGRIGGEEFAFILQRTHKEEATRIADNLRAAIAGTGVQLADTTIHYTVSLGVASLTAADTGLDSLLRRADLALYRAKQAGRNTVRIGEDSL